MSQKAKLKESIARLLAINLKSKESKRGFGLLYKLLKKRYKDALYQIALAFDDSPFGPSESPSEDISPMRIKSRPRYDTDSFISLPEKMIRASNKQKKPIAHNHRVLLWLASHLISDQLKLTFFEIKTFSSFRPIISGTNDGTSPELTKHKISNQTYGKENYQFNSSKEKRRPILVESISASQISENTTSTLLASVLHRIYLKFLKNTWNHLNELPRFKTSSVYTEKPSWRRKELIFDKLDEIKFQRKDRFPNKDRLKAGLKLLKAPLTVTTSRYSQDLPINQHTRESCPPQIFSLLRNLCKASRIKTFICFKLLRTFRLQVTSLNQLLSTSINPTPSDLRILKSLHNHWLSLMTEGKNIPNSKEKSAAFSKIFELMIEKISAEKQNSFLKVRTASQKRKSNLHSVISALMIALQRKQKISFMRMISLKKMVKFHRLHQETPPRLNKPQSIRKQAIEPHRVALLAKYFGGEKLIKTFSKRILSAFHTIRRHSAVENYRGFYSNWWKWKIANVNAKNHSEVRAHLRELSDEKSLRMQSEERLTKWMSNTSHQAQESQVNGIETRNQGFYLPNRDLQMNTDRDKRPESKIIIGSKKLIKRASVSSSIDSRRAIGGAEEKPFGLISSSNQNSIGFKPGSQGKSSSLERSAQKFPFFPVESIQTMFFKGNSQKATDNNLNLVRNYSFTNQANQISSCSLVDHFKLKLKEPRRGLLIDTNSFKESKIAHNPLKLELPSTKVNQKRLSKTTEEWKGQTVTLERFQTEPTDDSKALKIESQFDFSQTSSSRRFMKTAVQTLETPRTAEFLPSSRGNKQTLLELWTTRKLKQY